MMKQEETNKKNKEMKVLAAAAVVTAITVVGSTFAWLTSKDEVTNRLAVKSSYRTAIYETNFNPPNNWEVGQTVNKDVQIANTGNVDAVVKVWLDGAASMTYWEGVSEASPNPNGNEYRMLNLSEVTAIEAGGRLVTSTSNTYQNYTTTNPYKFKITNTGTFTEAGYYIFQRSEAESEGSSPTYSGYYCDGKGNYYGLYTKVTEQDESANTVISLELENPSGSISVDSNGKVTGYCLMKKKSIAEQIYLDYDDTKVNTEQIITVNVKESEESTAVLATFEIALANIGDKPAQWTYIAGKGFYYNDDLEASSENDKTSQLIDSITFKKAESYFESLTYDLNIHHESIQVFTDADGKESMPDQNETTTTTQPFADGVNAAIEHDGNEISKITWTAANT